MEAFCIALSFNPSPYPKPNPKSPYPGGIMGCIEALRAHAETRSVEAYGIALSFAAREPRATWRWAADFGLTAQRTAEGHELRDRMPAGAFDLVYTAMREDGLTPDAWCIRQGLISRAHRWPTDVRGPGSAVRHYLAVARVCLHVQCVGRAPTHVCTPVPVGARAGQGPRGSWQGWCRLWRCCASWCSIGAAEHGRALD